MVRIATVPVIYHYDTIYGVSLKDLTISGKCFSHHNKFMKTSTQSTCVTIKKSYFILSPSLYYKKMTSPMYYLNLFSFYFSFSYFLF